ncbi:hypothetical protein Ancab_024785 [Ancistrocladus abbreviatus]
MATVVAAGDRILAYYHLFVFFYAAGLLQNLSFNPQTKTKTKNGLEPPEPTKKLPSSQIATADKKDASNGHIPLSERSSSPLLPDAMDPSLCYTPNSYPHTTYYYGGYNGTGSDWDPYSRYPDGVEMTPGVYGDNGSLMYHHGFGYAPYGPYSPASSPVPTIGHDSQLYGHQQYQYPSPYFSPVTPPSETYTVTPAAAPQGDLSTTSGQSPFTVEMANGNGNTISNGSGKGTNGSAPIRPTYQNSSFGLNDSYGRTAFLSGVSASGYQDPRFGFDGMRSPIPWLDGPIFSAGQPRTVSSNSHASSVSHANNAPSSGNQNLHPHANVVGLQQPRQVSGFGTTHGFINRMYPSKLYGQYGNAVRTSLGYGSSSYDSRSNGRGWFALDNTKYKNRGRGNAFVGYGNENMDGLNELNRGPRAKSCKNQKAFAPIALAVRGQSITSNRNHDEEKGSLSLMVDGEQYNGSDFPENHADAKLFVIKSYSEDDVHKSIKYNVWSSTPNGNKKLDAAYLEAQEKSGGCPVFLFFSVNTSGQFVGLAEMVGRVDFHRSVDYWQQDKWSGSFPLKWHIVKDVPNSLLKHITLENNENKPVTNSRDTQEVKLDQGLQMLKIFKEHTSKTCILDDFGFYEARQKTIQEKKHKQQQFQKQVWEGNKDGANGEQMLHKSLDVPDLTKEAAISVQSNRDAKLSENGLVMKTVDAAKCPKLVCSENVVLNGVVNGC